MAKKNDHLADFETENTGGMLSGFLAEEEHLDWRAMLRLGTWGAASVGAVIIAILANQSSLRLRHDELAAADLSRQAQQIQSVARESQNETRRLASAIDTLNGDRDRMYSRLTTLEQGLDSVTGAIAKQKTAAAAPPAAPAPAALASPIAAASPSATPAVSGSAPQPVAEGAATTPAPAPRAAADPEPIIGPVATATAIAGKQVAEAKRREQANAKLATAAPTLTPASPPAPDQSNPLATTATMPLVSAKSMMGPPDPAAPKLIEPEPQAKTVADKTATVNAAAASPPPPSAPPPAAQTAQAASAAPAPEAIADKAATEEAATEQAAATDKAAADARPAPSAQIAVNRTEFGVDVGGANSVGGLRALWRGLLKSRSNAPLAALQPIIVVKEGNNGLGMQLRLVAGPLTDAAAAAKICARMVENDRPCATTVFDGQRLAMRADDAPGSTGTISARASSEKEKASSETEDKSPKASEKEKPAAEKPASPKSASGRWRRHSYSKRTGVGEQPKKPESTTSTLSSFFSRR